MSRLKLRIKKYIFLFSLSALLSLTNITEPQLLKHGFLFDGRPMGHVDCMSNPFASGCRGISARRSLPGEFPDFRNPLRLLLPTADINQMMMPSSGKMQMAQSMPIISRPPIMMMMMQPPPPLASGLSPDKPRPPSGNNNNNNMMMVMMQPSRANTRPGPAKSPESGQQMPMSMLMSMPNNRPNMMMTATKRR